MKTFLFQGDSITDADRRRDDINNFGYGYPNIVAAKYLSEFPNEFTFINKGISGNRIVDLYARIKIDLINLKPDYLSILIGINDVWHELSSENGVDNEKFKKILSMLIEEVKEAFNSFNRSMMTSCDSNCFLEWDDECSDWKYIDTESFFNKERWEIWIS